MRLGTFTSIQAAQLALLVLVIGDRANAHDLEIDQLRVWLDPKGGLHAQLILDPELTRPQDSTLSDAEARERVRAFAAANLALQTDGHDCAATLTTRELYVLGGAAPGDVVMLSCTPVQPVSHLQLKLGAAVPRLAVEAVGFTSSGTLPGDPLAAVRVVPGGTLLDFDRPTAVASALGALSNSAAHYNSAFDHFARFVWLGIEHIVPAGLDHVLFVVSLTLRKVEFRTLMGQLLAFTLAHTLTLGLGALGIVNVSPRWVEPLIALSIVIVALLNVRKPTPHERNGRVGLCFGFGLIHGLGFAGVLGGLGMPSQALLPALFGFNLGVEIAQVLVAASALFVLHFARRSREPSSVERWLTLAIAGFGLYLLLRQLQ
jgi:hypothetical protein